MLDTEDLPVAELSALRLDGELFGLGSSYCAIDEIDTPALRAASLARLAAPRLIAERFTAAWVWCAVDRCPERPEFCSSLDARSRPWKPLPIEHREVSIVRDDVQLVAGLAVTTPTRTLLDLARMPVEADHLVGTMRRLVADGLADGRSVLSDLTSRPNLPHSRRAVARLQEALDR
ncbi:hypothetical protein CLV46_1879 [Diaminobutyricimonas aerilata]|uniref:AbiEi antitoxin C-terminal domain-containing protein n=1 Tax=Diaminobutyricimonas aerilata TaxID=1162967 RepID=A0A2M9CK86_9MICO|nr:hypothetical protein CLV46_1879 [Diaminobutyricimonas aerilata]